MKPSKPKTVDCRALTQMAFVTDEMDQLEGGQLPKPDKKRREPTIYILKETVLTGSKELK